MQKKKLIITALTSIILLLVFFTIFIFTKPDYNCAFTPGPHYCQLDAKKPKLMERIASSFSEKQQVRLASSMLNFRTDLISKTENNQATLLAVQIYDEMQRESQWSKLPSSLGISYEKILNINTDQNQYFLFIPSHTPEQVLVFLHGFGGNFTSYLYVLSQVAEDTNSLLIAPSYKHGIWDADSLDFIDEVIAEVLVRADFDNASLNLIGFSNGGLIISDYIQYSQYSFSNIIGLSTYLDPTKYEDQKLIDKLTDSTFTYIYGDDDTRLGIDDSIKSLEYLKSNNITVNRVAIEGSHLVFFDKRNEVTTVIKDSIKSSEDY